MPQHYESKICNNNCKDRTENHNVFDCKKCRKKLHSLFNRQKRMLEYQNWFHCTGIVFLKSILQIDPMIMKTSNSTFAFEINMLAKRKKNIYIINFIPFRFPQNAYLKMKFTINQFKFESKILNKDRTKGTFIIPDRCLKGIKEDDIFIEYQCSVIFRNNEGIENAKNKKVGHKLSCQPLKNTQNSPLYIRSE